MSNSTNGTHKLLSANDILTVVDLPTEEVHVPEWGGYVIVRGMNGVERDNFEAHALGEDGRMSAKDTWLNIRARLVATCVVDPDGKRLFKDSQAEQLGRKSAIALNRVFEVAQRLSGLTDTDVEELEKNLEAAQSGNSGSN